MRATRLLSGLACAALAAVPLAPRLLGGAAAPLAPTSDVGQVVDYTFRTSPVNGVGLRSLDELRGKPVLIDFWGKR